MGRPSVGLFVREDIFVLVRNFTCETVIIMESRQFAGGGSTSMLTDSNLLRRSKELTLRTAASSFLRLVLGVFNKSDTPLIWGENVLSQLLNSRLQL